MTSRTATARLSRLAVGLSVSAAVLGPAATAWAWPDASIRGVSTLRDANHDHRASAGDVVVTTWDVSVDDGGTGLGADAWMTVNRGTVSCPHPSQLGGVTCRSVTTVTQADVDAGRFVIVGAGYGKVGGEYDAGPVFLSLTTRLAARPSVTLRQSLTLVHDPDQDGRIGAGDTVQVDYVVHNTGNQTLHRVGVSAPAIWGTPVDVTCTTTRLAPRQTTTCQSQALVVSSGLAAQGFVAARAQAHARSPQGVAVLSPSHTVTASTVLPSSVLAASGYSPVGLLVLALLLVLSGLGLRVAGRPIRSDQLQTI